MDLSLHGDPGTLESTGFIELVPGRYDGRHWRNDAVFVQADAFRLAEGILKRHEPDYSPYGMNDIPKDTALRIAREWRSVADVMAELEPREAAVLLEVSPRAGGRLFMALGEQRDEIAELLRGIAAWVEQSCETRDYVAVLGL